MRRLLLLLLCTAPLGADPGSDFKAAMEAEKAAKYEEALGSYDKVKKGLSGWAVVDRQRGYNLGRLGRNEEAVKALDDYLEAVPDDATAKDYRDRLKASLPGAAEPASVTAATEPAAAAIAAGGVDGVKIFMKDNPHDYRRLRIGTEFLTALGAGIDVGWRHKKHHDFGLGYAGGGGGTTSVSVFHPRYRYHNARFLWDSFYEVGMTFGNATDGKLSYSAFGLNLGLGVERVSAWPFNWFWQLNLGFLSASVSGGTSSFFTNSSSAVIPYLIPFGFSWGFLF